MLGIKETVHTSTMVASLNRAYDLVKINGVLNVSDLYIVDTVYKLLNTYCLELTNLQRRQLISTYNKIAFKSNEVCTGVLLDSFQSTSNKKFSQNFVRPEDIHKDDSIVIWKAQISKTIDEIFNELTVLPTNNISRTQAAEGLSLAESGVGRYCIFVNRQGTQSIRITDVLNNDITDYFEAREVESLNGVLYVTENMHTSEPTTLKITFYGGN